jgi:hypothetical protein
MAKWLLLIMALIMVPVQAAPPNTYRTPTCFSDVSKLPVYNLTAKLNKNAAAKLNSTVVLIGKDLWRTTAHSVGYRIDAYVTIIAPHKTIVAKVWLMDISGDVAYLSAPSDGLTPIPPLSKKLVPNEPTWNIGFPGLFDARLISTEGMFARYEKDGRITISAIGWGGMSGGAAVICNGDTLEMIGTITATKRSVLTSKVWTDEKGVVHLEKTLVNSGYTLVAPIKK